MPLQPPKPWPSRNAPYDPNYFDTPKPTRRNVMKRFYIKAVLAGAFVLAVMFLSIVMGQIVYGADYTRCIEATCRVSAGNSMGTGCVFSHHQGYAYILTNEHVVGSATEVDCEFWQQGHLSRKIRGKVTSVTKEADAAVIVIPLSSFEGHVPPAIPLADRDLIPGETVISVGCAKGAWATAFVGHLARVDADEIQFTPSPANGRSGSAIFSADGSCIIGLLRARNETAHLGVACTVRRLIRFLRIGVRTVALRLTQAQCGPNGCSPSDPTHRYLLPFRRQQTQPQQVYPTLPQQPYVAPQQPVPIQPVDLSGVEGKLDRLLTLQEQLIQSLDAANPPPPQEIAPRTPDIVAPVAPPVVAPQVLGIPSERIAGAVTEAVGAAADHEGTFGEKARSGIANLLVNESENGAVSDTLIRGLLGSLLGPWGLLAAVGVIWVKNRFFSSWSRSLDPTKQDTPAQTRQKEGMKTLQKDALREVLAEKTPGSPGEKT